MCPCSIITPLMRERLAREYDDRGPEACTAEVVAELKRNNPELLDMATKCAASLANGPRVMMGLGMFYRLMLAPAVPDDPHSFLSPLPRVSPGIRDELVGQIDAMGTEPFTLAIIEDLERDNPELLQMAHGFASREPNYLPVMQGFALLYKSLAVQAAADRAGLH